MAKKKNKQDLTLTNLKSIKAKIAALANELDHLEVEFKTLKNKY